MAVRAAEIVGFSIADRASGSIFALFVLPEHERRGIGSCLHGLALDWLWANGMTRLWPTTDPTSKAACFYERRGWRATGAAEHGDMRYEIMRPAPT